METDDTVGVTDDTVGIGDATATDMGRTPRDRPVEVRAGLVGRKLAHFQIEELLGRGGMGEVYRATDLALDRSVAVKVLSRTIAEDAKLRDRFYREARAQARIQHPNVCHIYYIGEEEELLFFAMEYIDGESLSDRLKERGKLDAADAVEMCRMAALGLREAHRHGFTHRDVKPSNLMVDSSGVVKLVDFGLVKQTAETIEPGPMGDVDKTAIVGTPLYMAPEQATGEGVDFRSDIYALGATLHHLVSGAPPFSGDTPHEVVSQHRTASRPAIERKRRRRGPAPIDGLCDRMMAKEPADRFSDYDQLIAAMENISPARTRAAGFWVRVFALAIDALLIRIAMIPFELVLPDEVGTPLFVVLTVLYFVIGHGRFGRTLGKSALEIEVVTADRHAPPGMRAAALRFVVQWAPFYILVGAVETSEVLAAPNWLTIVFAVMLGVTVLILYPLEGALSSWLVPGKRTYWDRIAGTRVRYRRLTSS